MEATGTENEHPWWKTSVVYQIYPRSFSDSNGDGVGDLEGIRSRLDYLQWLGVDVLWLSPVFRSPMADFGYDVSDYCDIDPIFGSIADMDALIGDCHRRGMKLMLDWVPNHTSVEHPWFIESRANRTNPKADWYVWRDEPANNWMAGLSTGESAWEFDETRNQYYLRLFLRHQPDLNWDNPDVEAAMHDTLRFWMDRGVDGFRMDVVHLIGKELDRDDPEQARQHGHVPYNDVPITHERLRAIRNVLEEYPGDRASVGEVYLLDEARMAEYYGDRDELHMSFNFSFLWTRWKAAALRARILSTMSHLQPRGAWPTWVLSNHDVPRHRQRYGGAEAAARTAAVMLLTLPGTPFIYQGEELGLIDADVSPDTQADPGGRDGCRAPIPWTSEPNHGWTNGAWLPFAPEGEHRNVTALQVEAGSILHLYRTMLRIRHQHRALQTGTFTMFEHDDDAVVYERSDGARRYLVVLNLGDEPVEVPEAIGATVVLSSVTGEPISADQRSGGTISARSAEILLLP